MVLTVEPVAGCIPSKYSSSMPLSEVFPFFFFQVLNDIQDRLINLVSLTDYRPLHPSEALLVH